MAERTAEITPFLMRFGEKIKPSEAAPSIPGRYNPELQVWEYSDALSKSFPVASFPQEKGPTISTVVTWLAPPALPKTDMGPDD